MHTWWCDNGATFVVSTDDGMSCLFVWEGEGITKSDLIFSLEGRPFFAINLFTSSSWLWWCSQWGWQSHLVNNRLMMLTFKKNVQCFFSPISTFYESINFPLQTFFSMHLHFCARMTWVGHKIIKNVTSHYIHSCSSPLIRGCKK